jgi:hypothetical protein
MLRHVDPRDRSGSDIGLETGCKIVPLPSDWSMMGEAAITAFAKSWRRE